MELENAKGSSQNLDTIDSNSPETLFSLFFTDTVLNRIVRCTNLNAEKVRVDPVATRAKNIRFHDSLNQLPWKPVTSSEILAYLGILIYMGIHVEPEIDDYWNTSEEDRPIHQAVRKTMSKHRWQQIDRYLHVWNPTLDQPFERLDDKVRPHQKVDPLWKLLSSSFQRYWKSGRDLAIDECIEANYRTWKPLWNYLLQTTICNAALIWMDQGHSTKKGGGHLKFRTKLASQLMAHSSSFKHASPIDGFGVRTNIRNHIITSKNGCNGTHDVISQSAKECKACMAQGRTAQASGKRMVLQELSNNSVRINQNGEKSRRPRPPRTRYGCSTCQIHLCQGGTCWEEHIQSSKLE